MLKSKKPIKKEAKEISYQIHLEFNKDSTIEIGKLGKFTFKKGLYIYTGSAKRNIDARIKRHLKKDKKLHWHIDFLTSSPNCKIIKTNKFSQEECALNQATKGRIIINHFGSSDCKKSCISHLKFITKN